MDKKDVDEWCVWRMATGDLSTISADCCPLRALSSSVCHGGARSSVGAESAAQTAHRIAAHSPSRIGAILAVGKCDERHLGFGSACQLFAGLLVDNFSTGAALWDLDAVFLDRYS